MTRPSGFKRDINSIYLGRNIRTNEKYVMRLASDLEQQQLKDNAFSQLNEDEIYDYENLVQFLSEKLNVDVNTISNLIHEFVDQKMLATTKMGSTTFYKKVVV